MRRVAHGVAWICDRLVTLCMWSLVVVGAAMSIIVLLQVVFRFLIHVPFPWSEELARYLMIWMGMLGAFVALRQGRHIGVGVFVDRLPPSLGSKVRVTVQLITIGFLAIVARFGFSLASLNAGQLSPAMRIPMTFPYLAIPVGSCLMILELIRGLLEELAGEEVTRKRRLTSATLDG